MANANPPPSRRELARPRQKPTIRDVARRAGVSLGTASAVLNGHSIVSEVRRNRVEEAIAALGYVPNGVAQSLRRKSSRVIGLCTALNESAFFSALLASFEEIAAREGYELMQVLSRSDPALEARRMGALLARQVDGVILIPTIDPTSTFDLIHSSGVPAVVVDRLAEDRRFDYVTIDDRGAMLEATGQLRALGHRRLLYVVRNRLLVTTQRRIEGFVAACAAAPRGTKGFVCQRDPDDAAFAVQLATILRGDAPTAIIASNSELTLTILRILKGLALRVPQDLSLLAFDEPNWAEILTPTLSVIRHPTTAIATTAWRLLLGRMAGDVRPCRRLALRAEVVLRESVQSPRLARSGADA